MQLTTVSITDNFAIKWPNNTQDYLSIHPNEKKSVEFFLKAFVHTYLPQIYLSKENLPALEIKELPIYVPKNTYFEYAGKKTTLGQDLVFLYTENKKIKKIFLLIKNENSIIGRGSKRVVRKCYDLIKGVFKVIKLCKLKEKLLLESLQKTEGIPRTYCFFECRQLYTIEKYYELGNLADFLIRGRLIETRDKLNLMHNLLSAIKALEGKASVHLDIKPENILIEDKNGSLKAVLSDYGNLNSTQKIKGPPLFYPPELYEMFRENNDSHPSELRIKKFHDEFGSARDIWALGIVFGGILKNSYPETGYVFSFLEKAFTPALSKNEGKPILFHRKVFHSKEDMHIELERLSLSFKNESISKAFALTCKMLSFLPENRPTATQALDQLDQIIVNNRA